MSTISRTVLQRWRNSKTLTARQIIWILHLLRWPIRGMPRNGALPSCQQWSTSADASLASIGVSPGTLVQIRGAFITKVI